MSKEKIMKNANTPTKRVGIILLVVAAIMIFITIVHWNITERTFFYYKKDIREYFRTFPGYEDGGDGENGTIYYRDYNGLKNIGWIKYNKACIEKSGWKRRPEYVGGVNMGDKADMPPSECELEKFTHAFRQDRSGWRTSLDSYWEEMMETDGMYFLFTLISAITSVLGIFAYCGYLEKFIRWVKTGSSH